MFSLGTNAHGHCLVETFLNLSVHFVWSTLNRSTHFVTSRDQAQMRERDQPRGVSALNLNLRVGTVRGAEL